MTQFARLGGLLGLGERADVDIRPTLLRVLTDLYVQKPAHPHDEEEQYTELALRLIDSVDEGTRQAVQARLAAYASAPQRVVERLAAHGAAPAPTTTASVTRLPVLQQPAPTAGELTEMFFAASPEERRLILSNLDGACADDAPHAPPADADAIAHRLESAVLRRNLDEAVFQLQRALSISQVAARRIVSDPTGEPFVAAAKVIGVSKEVLQRILLFLSPTIGRSVQRVYELARLYEEISAPAAAQLIAILRRADPALPDEPAPPPERAAPPVARRERPRPALPTRDSSFLDAPVYRPGRAMGRIRGNPAGES